MNFSFLFRASGGYFNVNPLDTTASPVIEEVDNDAGDPPSSIHPLRLPPPPRRKVQVNIRPVPSNNVSLINSRIDMPSMADMTDVDSNPLAPGPLNLNTQHSGNASNLADPTDLNTRVSYVNLPDDTTPSAIIEEVDNDSDVQPSSIHYFQFLPLGPPAPAPSNHLLTLPCASTSSGTNGLELDSHANNPTQHTSSRRPPKRQNTSIDLEDASNILDHKVLEVGEDGSYRHHTKIRLIQDPRLRCENDQLLDELLQERVKSNLLNEQLHESQMGQMRNVWNARNICDQITLENRQLAVQLQDARRANHHTESELAELARFLGISFDDVIEGSDQLQSSSSRLTADALISQDEAMEASQRTTRASRTIERVQHLLSERDRENEESQAELSRLQALHQQHLEQSARAHANAQLRARELEQAQMQVQELEQQQQQLQQGNRENRLHENRIQNEIQDLQNQRRQLQRQVEEQQNNLVAQASQVRQEREATTELQQRLLQQEQESATEAQRRIQEQQRSHEQALRNEVNRLQAEHNRQLAVLEQARLDLENRLNEAEAQAEASSVPAEATSRSEEALRSVLQHDEARVSANETRREELAEEPGLSADQVPDTNPSASLSQMARGKLPADPRLARIRAANLSSQIQQSHRQVSFDITGETISPPLRIPRPYSSTSTPETPRHQHDGLHIIPALPLQLVNPSEHQQLQCRAVKVMIELLMNMLKPPQTLLRVAIIIPALPLQLVNPSEHQQLQHRAVKVMIKLLMNILKPPQTLLRVAIIPQTQLSMKILTPSQDPDLPTILTLLTNLSGNVNSLRGEFQAAVSAINHQGSTPSPRTSRHALYKPADTPSRVQEREHVDMMSAVRNKIKDKLSIRVDADIGKVTRDNQHMASPEEVDSFDDGGPGPTLVPFRPYWDYTRCQWNLDLAGLLVDELVADGHDFSGDLRQKAINHVILRFDVLKKAMRRQLPRPNETDEQATERAELQGGIGRALNRVTNRRQSLYHSRLQICKEGFETPQQAIWRALHRMVLALNRAGQSSDESEDESKDTFTVRDQPWRSSEVTELLRYIDSHRRATNNYGNNRSGKPFRTRRRVRNPPESHSKPVSGLPKNFYEPQWLCTQPHRAQLNIQDPIALPEFDTMDESDLHQQAMSLRRATPSLSRPSHMMASSRHATSLRSSQTISRRLTQPVYYNSDEEVPEDEEDQDEDEDDYVEHS
ncbi:hypothetical protein J132_09972 [Termitomyces sp. J132]|nr:hypothetical protein J132_09972 [Termitomyces sp. J132]